MAALAAAAMLAGDTPGATTAGGTLTYRSCITGELESGPAGSGACRAIRTASPQGANSGFDTLQTLALSANGKSLYATSLNDDAVARFARSPRTGALTYRGCISGETESGPALDARACRTIQKAASQGMNSGLNGLFWVVLSGNGKSLYVTSQDDDAVARFARNRRTGALAYRGCVTGETESGPAGSGACQAIPKAASGGVNSGLDVLRAVVLSSDGKSLYAVSNADAAVAHFSRNRRTGALTYRGCITGETQSGPAGTGACRAIPTAASQGEQSGLSELRWLALSANRRSLYTSSEGDAAVAHFSRNPRTGALTYRGCITGETQSGPAGTGACRAIPKAASLGENSGLDFLRSVVLSGDGKWLYASSGGDAAVARFRRNARTGTLAYRGCITGSSASGPAPGTGACRTIPTVSSDPNGLGANSGLANLDSLALSKNGRWLYAVSQDDDAAVRFARNPRAGTLAYRGCTTGDAESGPAGSSACRAIPRASSAGINSGLDLLRSVLLTGDGRSLYAISARDDAVVGFRRR